MAKETKPKDTIILPTEQDFTTSQTGY